VSARRARERDLHPAIPRHDGERRHRRRGAARRRRDRRGRARRTHGALAPGPGRQPAARLAEDHRRLDERGRGRRGVDRDRRGGRPLGAIVVAGNIKSGFTTRRYLARLNEWGQPLWEDPGLKIGEEISGLAVASTGEIAAAGAVRTNPDDPNPAFDSSTWVYPNGYHPSQGAVIPDVFGQPDTDPLPDEFNARSERARAVVAREGGGFVVFGEREYKDGNFMVYSRATAQRYTSMGARDGALWTSPGLKFLHDAALAATVTETGFLAAGWCRHDIAGALRQVCVQEFDEDGALVGFFAETSPTQAEARAVAQDREHKIVLGGFLSKPGQTDAWVFASRGADQPLAWSQKYNGGGWDFATGVGCDLWGHCTWVGSTIVDGALVLVVSQRQP
jgi:hypothetical protein